MYTSCICISKTSTYCRVCFLRNGNTSAHTCKNQIIERYLSKFLSDIVMLLFCYFVYTLLVYINLDIFTEACLQGIVFLCWTLLAVLCDWVLTPASFLCCTWTCQTQEPWNFAVFVPKGNHMYLFASNNFQLGSPVTSHNHMHSYAWSTSLDVMFSLVIPNSMCFS